jgi:hypothetical protein
MKAVAAGVAVQGARCRRRDVARTDGERGSLCTPHSKLEPLSQKGGIDPPLNLLFLDQRISIGALGGQVKEKF